MANQTAGTVTVQPDSTGKKIDTSELVVGANTVERQNVVLADSSNANALAGVSLNGDLAVEDTDGRDIQRLILTELRVLTHLIAAVFDTEASLDALRAAYLEQ